LMNLLHMAQSLFVRVSTASVVAVVVVVVVVMVVVLLTAAVVAATVVVVLLVDMAHDLGHVVPQMSPTEVPLGNAGILSLALPKQLPTISRSKKHSLISPSEAAIIIEYSMSWQVSVRQVT